MFRVQGHGLRFQGLGLRASGFEFACLGSGSEGFGQGYGVSGFFFFVNR